MDLIFFIVSPNNFSEFQQFHFEPKIVLESKIFGIFLDPKSFLNTQQIFKTKKNLVLTNFFDPKIQLGSKIYLKLDFDCGTYSLACFDLSSGKCCLNNCHKDNCP